MLLCFHGVAGFGHLSNLRVRVTKTIVDIRSNDSLLLVMAISDIKYQISIPGIYSILTKSMASCAELFVRSHTFNGSSGHA